MSRPCVGYRSFHNIIKKNLYKRICQDIDVLYELGVGRGGDLWKWKDCKVKNVIGIDSDNDSLNEAIKRFSKLKRNRNCNIKCLFIHYSLKEYFLDSIHEKVMLDFKKGNVSCQFALQFFCETKECLINFFKQVNRITRLNGIFFGTTISGQRNRELLNGKDVYENDLFRIEKINESSYKFKIFQNKNGYFRFIEERIPVEHFLSIDVLNEVAIETGFIPISLPGGEYTSATSLLSIEYFKDWQNKTNLTVNLNKDEIILASLYFSFVFKKIKEI